MTSIEECYHKPEIVCHWNVYTLDGQGAGDFGAYDYLADLTPSGVIAIVFHHIPELRGKNFVVNDEDMEKLYIRWDEKTNQYDEYVHTDWVDPDE